jgi:hypothetical protein
MSETAPKAPQSEEAVDRAALHNTSTGELLSRVDDLVGDRFRVTSNDRLQLKAGVTATDSEGNSRNIGGKFTSKHQLEDIVAFKDQIELGIKAKEISSVAPEIDAALEYAREQAATMNETRPTTLKEVSVMRHALVKSKAISALEVGKMNDDEVRTLVDYMHLENEVAETSESENEAEESVQHEFVVGQSVRVLRGAGKFEEGWYVSKQLEGNNYKVTRKNADDTELEETVEGAKLKLWNTVDTSEPFVAPTLTPLDAPASDAVIVGEVAGRDSLGDDREGPRIITPESIIANIKEIPVYLAARLMAASYNRKNKDTSARPERNRSRTIMAGAVGVLAVGVVSYLAFRGHDTSSAHELATGNSLDTPLQDITLPGAGNNAGGGHDIARSAAQVADHTNHFSNEALTAARGEGWTHQLHDMGFSDNEIPTILKKLTKAQDPAVREWVYTMKDGNPGIAKPGQIPANVLQSIQKLR